jgi:hypothetical protein
MDMKLLAAAAAIATGAGLSVLTPGAGLVQAAPSNPFPPCLLNCQPGTASAPQDNPLPPNSAGIWVPGSRNISPPVGAARRVEDGQSS